MSSQRRQVAKALAGVKSGTVHDHYTERYGVHKGAFRAGHMVQIALVAWEHGRDFTNEQYAAYWGVTERTGWMHRAEAEEVYGEDRWRDVAVLLAAAMDEAGVWAPGRAARLSFTPAALRR